MERDFANLLAIFVGSGIGGVARYLVGCVLGSCGRFSGVPLGTFAVNVVGCFLIGMIYGVAVDAPWLSERVKLLLTVGFCGGFTTFSTMANEGRMMLEANNMVGLCLYVAVSVVCGLLCVCLGYNVVR